jgi:hypothetical protein
MSLISEIKKNNGKISAYELNRSLKKFLDLYANHQEPGMSFEEGRSWLSRDGRVEICGYTNTNVDLEAKADGESRGSTEIIVDGIQVFRYEEYLDPSFSDIPNYKSREIHATPAEPWLVAVYQYHKEIAPQKVNEPAAELTA